MYLKLKINIKKYLILLVVGFIASSSFLIIPQKTLAGEQTNQGGNTTPPPTSGCDQLTTGSVALQFKEPEAQLYFKNSIKINIKYQIPESIQKQCSDPNVYKNTKIDVWLQIPGHTDPPPHDIGKYNFRQDRDLDLAIDSLNISPVKTGDVVTGFEAGATIIYPSFLRSEDLKKFQDDPNATISTTIIPYVRSVARNGIIYNSYGTAVAQKEVILVGDKAKESIVDPNFEQTISSISGPEKNPYDVGAQTLANFIAEVIGTIVSYINEFIYFVTSSVIAPTMEALLGIRTYTDAFASVILPGWEVLRNISNIFFIVVMLIIALATLFRVQNYQYKNLLISLILAALLVNFSLVIAQGVLGIAETVQDQFLPVTDAKDPTHGTSHNVIATLANALMRDPIKSFNDLKQTNTSLTSSLSSITLPIFYLILAVAGFITMLSLLVFILIRIVALWILLMLSPIAYVAGVLPLTKNYRGQWWREFIKYAFFVAIIGFFLNIAALMAQKGQEVFKAIGADTSKLGSLETFILQVGTNLMLIVFIFAGLKAASSMGVYGAKAVTDAVTKGTLKPFRLARDAAKGAGNYVGDRITERAPILSPTQWKEGYQKYKEDYAKKYRERVEASKQKDTFGVPARVGLNNPEQFLKNFGTASGWKKMFQTTSQQTDQNTSEAYKERAGIQTEEERRNALLEQGKSKRLIDDINSPGGDLDRLRSSNSVEAGSAAGDELSASLGKHLEELNAKRIQFEDARDVLQGQGKTAEASTMDDRALEMSHDIAEIEAYKNTLDTGAAGTVVSIPNIILDVDNADLKTELGKLNAQITDAVTKQVKGLQEEVKKVNDEGKADDKLRKKHNFSEFNAAGKAGDPKYKEFLEDTRNEALKQAGIRAESAKGKEFSPVYDNAILHTAAVGKATKELEEKGIELVPELIDVLERDMRNRNLSEKERAAKLEATLTKIYKEGGAKDVLERFKRDVSFSGQQDFMKNGLGLSGEQSTQLSGRLDKILNSLKQYNLSNTVQRVGGQYSYRDQGSHNTAYSKKIGGLTLGETVNLPPEALVNTAKGKSPVITTAVLSQFSKASGNLRELDSIRSKIAPGKARVLVNSSNFGSLPGDVQRVIRDKAT